MKVLSPEGAFLLSDGKAKETEVLLLLYEFEALIKLRDSRVETLLEKALTLPTSDPKTFETMAGESFCYSFQDSYSTYSRTSMARTPLES